MDYFTVTARVLEQALIAWNHKERFSFIKKLVKIRLEYEKEYNKPSFLDKADYPDAPVSAFRDARIVRSLERELLIISEEYITRLPPQPSI